MKAIVFGGSGFLGSHVADILSSEGYEVTIYDIRPSDFIKDNQKMFVGDVCNKQQIRKAIKGSDIVYHFAAIADIAEAHENPVKCIEINILSTTYILEACKEFNIKRFIFGSTIYVYSDHGSFYRVSKQSCELIIENYSKIYDLDYTILRYGSLYGPRSNKFNFIKSAIQQAMLKKEIIRNGNGNELRDYIHIVDAARASVSALDEQYINSNIMITGMKSIKIKDLLLMIQEMFDYQIEIKYVDKKNKGHYNITPYTFKPKVAQKLNFNHYYDLGQGILQQIHIEYDELLASKKIKSNNDFTK